MYSRTGSGTKYRMESPCLTRSRTFVAERSIVGTGMTRAFEGLLARGQNRHAAPQRVRRCLRHDQMCDMHGVERSPEQRPPGHAAQGVEGVDEVGLESAAAGQVRSSPVA